MGVRIVAFILISASFYDTVVILPLLLPLLTQTKLRLKTSMKPLLFVIPESRTRQMGAM